MSATYKLLINYTNYTIILLAQKMQITLDYKNYSDLTNSS